MANTAKTFVVLMRMLLSTHPWAAWLSLMCITYEMFFDTILKAAFQVRTSHDEH